MPPGEAGKHNYTIEKQRQSTTSDTGMLRHMKTDELKSCVMLKQWPYTILLKDLYLSNNNISDAGTVTLVQALHHNSTLKVLYLYGNNAIGEQGTHQLVQALTVKTTHSRYGLRFPKWSV